MAVKFSVNVQELVRQAENLHELNERFKNEVMIMTGAEIKIGDVPVAKANERAAKPTSERPCPIKEYFFKTKITPRSEAQTETKTPTINAFTMKG